MTPTDADRNLLFGVLALQGDLIDSGQFAEACTVWAARKAEERYAGIPPKEPIDVFFRAGLLALRARLIGAGKADAALDAGERAERRCLADEAMGPLKRAVAYGFRNVNAMRSDYALESPRSRPDFQELLRSLERPTR
jgi:hypothetical protein